MQDIGQQFWEEFGKQKRQRKQRLVKIDGHDVLLVNVYSMEQVRWKGAWGPGSE